MKKLFSKDFLVKFTKRSLITIVVALIILFVIYSVSFIKEGFVMKSYIVYPFKYLCRGILIIIFGVFFSTILDYVSEDNKI